MRRRGGFTFILACKAYIFRTTAITLNDTRSDVLIRLVRMTFRPDEVQTFLSIFDDSSPRIRAFPGCHHLELWQDTSFPNILTTMSRWEDEAALERYRASGLFTGTWARTKPLFASRPEVHSYDLARPHPAQ